MKDLLWLSFLMIGAEGFLGELGGRDKSSSSCVMSRRPISTSRLYSTTLPTSTSPSVGSPVPAFLMQSFNTECDNINRPPSLNILLRSLQQLTYSGSDIRGRYVEHPRLGSIASVAHEIGKLPSGSQPPLTPFAAHCFGYALAGQLLDMAAATNTPGNSDKKDKVQIVIGQDPREHGMRLADAFARGAESADPRIRVVYTGLATTPGCSAFPRIHGSQAAVMVTASHLPADRNGFKVFYNGGVGMTHLQLYDLGVRAMECATEWYNKGVLPPSSGHAAVMCSSHVDYMPAYTESLRQAIINQVGSVGGDQPLKGLKIVLNAGNGSGGFFQQVLANLGADPEISIHLNPQSDFPNGVPNPEYAPMFEATIAACEKVHADLGIMLDTDADRCGFVAPRTVLEDGTRSDYQPLNRNPLIALLAVIFAERSPGCTFVTDSTTSEGLTTFLQDHLGLNHIRYLKGYANVINKAKELDAAVAIETSGHCAMKENDYLDDGTYTAVKVVSLLAKRSSASLFDSIAFMEELDEIAELRMEVKDQSLETMREIFDFCALEIENHCESDASWRIDRENLEGIRCRAGKQKQFFMLRKSLHDPIISLQIEAKSKAEARELVVKPLLGLFESEERIRENLVTKVLEEY